MYPYQFEFCPIRQHNSARWRNARKSPKFYCMDGPYGTYEIETFLGFSKILQNIASILIIFQKVPNLGIVLQMHAATYGSIDMTSHPIFSCPSFGHTSVVTSDYDSNFCRLPNQVHTNRDITTLIPTSFFLFATLRLWRQLRTAFPSISFVIFYWLRPDIKLYKTQRFA